MKNIKKIIAVTLVGAMLLPLAGCAKKIEHIRAGEFKDAIEEVFDDDDYVSYGDMIAVTDDDYAIVFTQFDDEDDAEEAWEDMVDSFEDMMDDKDFDGRARLVNRDTYGYILLNGECDDRDFYTGRSYMYGGIYFVEDEAFAILTVEDDNDTRNDVNTILRALGLPRP